MTLKLSGKKREINMNQKVENSMKLRDADLLAKAEGTEIYSIMYKGYELSASDKNLEEFADYELANVVDEPRTFYVPMPYCYTYQKLVKIAYLK